MSRVARIQRSLIALTLLLSAIAAPIYAVKVHQKSDYTDFSVYYRAAERMKLGNWDQVYTLADGASPFRYAPTTLPFFRPFAEVSPETAKMAWYCLQVLWFGAGFLALYFALFRALKRARKPALPPRSLAAGATTAVAALFIFRFCLDTFTIGQVSSFLFLGLALAAYFWSRGQTLLASLCLLLPTLFKIGPGVLYFAFLGTRARRLLRAALGASGLLALLSLLAAAWSHFQGASALALWKTWALIVAKDSEYYDASHYGSQSIKSALLRLANSGLVDSSTASTLYLLSAFLILFVWLGFCLLRRARATSGRLLCFSLGVFPYIWLMPETFKYTLTALGLPVAALALTLTSESASASRRLSLLALSLSAFALPLAGKDLVGDPLFFWIQKNSLPLLASFLLGFAVFRAAWEHSSPSRLAKRIGGLLRPRSPGPWRNPPRSLNQPHLQASLLIPIPLDSRIRLSEGMVPRFLESVNRTLSEALNENFEILLIPFGDRVSELHPLWEEALGLEKKLSFVRAVSPFSTSRQSQVATERGLALREGFLASQGALILSAHIEQPCDPLFYLEALRRSGEGYSLVRGNRRLPESRFRIPVRWLPIVYGRHRLGLLFNRLVKLFLPSGSLHTQDTHSGTWALSRPFATEVFALQGFPGFLFDLELSLLARARSVRELDLPLTIELSLEKSFLRMTSETFSILAGLPRLAWRYSKGYYSPAPSRSSSSSTQLNWITADDWGISPGVNEGILALASSQVVRRVSIMAHGAFIEQGLQELLALKRSLPDLKLGLHFDLTHQKESPGKVLLRWLSPFSDREALVKAARAEFEAQIARLRGLGITPDYLDGHHHIHLVPGLMEVLAEPLRNAGIRQVRLPYDPGLWFSAKFPLLLLCVLARGKIRKLGFESLPCFYPSLDELRDFAKMRVALASRPGTEVIVHPAMRSDFLELGIQDPYQAERVEEYLALRMHAQGELPCEK